MKSPFATVTLVPTALEGLEKITTLRREQSRPPYKQLSSSWYSAIMAFVLPMDFRKGLATGDNEDSKKCGSPRGF
jgi:hypothetical protein